MSETPSSDNSAFAPSAADSGSDKAAISSTTRSNTAKHAKGGGIGRTLFIVMLLAGIAAGGYFLWNRQEVTQRGVDADAAFVKQRWDALAGRTEQIERHVEARPGTIANL